MFPVFFLLFFFLVSVTVLQQLSDIVYSNSATIQWFFNKDRTCKDKDKDKDFTYSYLLQVAAKPPIAIKQQQWTQSESSQHMTVKHITLNK